MIRGGHKDATAAGQVLLGGERLAADPSGALWWPAMRLLAVADLHFEKGSAFARGGQFLPPFDTRATLRRLAEAIDRHRPKIVIALGDSFHDRGGPDRLHAEDRAQLASLTAGCEWIWITGNHDADAAEQCGGTASDEVAIGGLVFRHEPQAGTRAGEVAGHLHPKAHVILKGARISRPCFAADAQRIILPAFGAFTGGLDLTDAAFRPLFPSGYRALLLGKHRVYAFSQGRAAAE